MRVVAHGGVGEIGGNAIEVQSGGTRILLDFGLPFGRYGEAFSEFLKPRRVAGMGDWLLSGVAPDLQGAYRQDYRAQTGAREEARAFDGVVLSHPHLDHMGLVPLLRPDIPVVGSRTAYGIAHAIEATGGSFSESDYVSFRPQYRLRASDKKGDEGRLVRVKGEEARSDRPWLTDGKHQLGDIRVELMAVDHSVHGARGILAEGPDASIAYSGDLRLHGRHREWTERWAARCGGVDALLIEGTNVANEAKERAHGHLHDFKQAGELTEAGVEDYLAEKVAAEAGHVFVAYPQRDLDRLETFLRVARRTGRKLCLTLKQAELLQQVHAHASAALDAEVPTLDHPDLCIYVPRKGWGLTERDDLWDTQMHVVEQDYATWERAYLHHRATVFRSDIAQDPGSYLVFADVWNLTELHEFQPQGGLYVSSKTEPFDEEMALSRERLTWWLRKWNLQEVGAHVSGHAPLHELLWLADEVGARKVIPIHTEGTDVYAQRLGARAVVPQLGQEIVVGR